MFGQTTFSFLLRPNWRPFLLALVPSVILGFLPMPQLALGGIRSESRTFVDVAGVSAVVLLLFPVAVTSLPLLLPLRRARILAAVVLGIFVLVTLINVGVYYIPAWITEILAAERAQEADI